MEMLGERGFFCMFAVMKHLLSLPPNVVESFRRLNPRFQSSDWFSTSDPVGHRLGSGSGTVWLLDKWESEAELHELKDKKVIIHAGGQSRRLPAYAAPGKIFAPIPVIRWALGQQIDQDILSLQLPLYEKLLENAPDRLHTLIASGDVVLRCDEHSLPPIPEDADVVCIGLWADTELTSRHGVFLSSTESPQTLDFMLQKPSVEELNRLSTTHYYMIDTGLWILSDKAIDRLRKKARAEASDDPQDYAFYDLYTQFGGALGNNPSRPDADLADLNVCIIPLPKGEFYHFGTTRELISSTLALQNIVTDQRLIQRRISRPHPSQFTQNCIRKIPLTAENTDIWIENAVVGSRWTLTRQNVVTGVPDNDWQISLPEGACLDIQPIGECQWVVRPYGFDDPMRGATEDPTTQFLGQPLQKWLKDRTLTLPSADDIQTAALFPVVDNLEEMELLARFMISEPGLDEGRKAWKNARRISAEEILDYSNIIRLNSDRRQKQKQNILQLAENHEQSIFYQLDLDHLALQMADHRLDAPEALDESAPVIDRIRNRMLRNRVRAMQQLEAKADEAEAYALLKQGILDTLNTDRAIPVRSAETDQIVWARSPVRIDLAGGWTDTPPYSIVRGGNVANMAVELNGQPPLQVFVKTSHVPHIILHSIDLGASETITTYEQLTDYNRVNSPFSIPKAALALAGFAPEFSPQSYSTLRHRLEAFGGGIEMTLLSALPAGSGMGTSSILAATVLGALNNFFTLRWDSNEICNRTLALEQLLTAGGGWQDQYGGILPGIKLLQSVPGWQQHPSSSWLPADIFTTPQLAPCHLLYYTGLTRTAKSILTEISRRMILNSSSTISLLDDMRYHALKMAEAIQRCDYQEYGRLINITWRQNQLLDSGTNPPETESIIRKISDLCLGLKLPGAGGGGFLYMAAKDPEAAARIRQILTETPPNHAARFVDMTLSTTGLQISRS